MRARVRETLEQCAPAFFDAAWPGLAARMAADQRMKADLRDRHGLAAALAAVSGAIALRPKATALSWTSSRTTPRAPERPG